MDELSMFVDTMETQGPILPIAYTGLRVITFPLHEIVIVNKEVLEIVNRSFVGATAPRIAPLVSDRVMSGP
jgi:hypothetical protein